MRRRRPLHLLALRLRQHTRHGVWRGVRRSRIERRALRRVRRSLRRRAVVLEQSLRVPERLARLRLRLHRHGQRSTQLRSVRQYLPRRRDVQRWLLPVSERADSLWQRLRRHGREHHELRSLWQRLSVGCRVRGWRLRLPGQRHALRLVLRRHIVERQQLRLVLERLPDAVLLRGWRVCVRRREDALRRVLPRHQQRWVQLRWLRRHVSNGPVVQRRCVWMPRDERNLLRRLWRLRGSDDERLTLWCMRHRMPDLRRRVLRWRRVCVQRDADLLQRERALRRHDDRREQLRRVRRHVCDGCHVSLGGLLLPRDAERLRRSLRRPHARRSELRCLWNYVRSRRHLYRVRVRVPGQRTDRVRRQLRRDADRRG